jgi:hypothetical protein
MKNLIKYHSGRSPFRLIVYFMILLIMAPVSIVLEQSINLIDFMNHKMILIADIVKDWAYAVR